MKKILLKQAVILAAAAFAVSCIKPEVPEGSSGKGKLVISGMTVSEDVRETSHNNEKSLTRAGVSTDNFNVRITKTQDGAEVLNCNYDDVPSPLELAVGDYSITIQSHAVQPAEWDKIHYSVSEFFSIVEDETTTLDNLVCKVANILVSVTFSEKMKPLMGEGCHVNVKVGNCGPLAYNANEARKGCFKPEQETNSLVWEFSGTIDGEYYNETDFVLNAKAGEHHTLKFDVELAPDPEKGDAEFTFNISAEVESYDINLNVYIDAEDVIEPLDPAIFITSDFSLTDRTTIKKSEIPASGPVVSIDAQAGISSLTFTVVTDNAALAGAMASQGITGAVNLVTVEEPLKSVLGALGFPTGGDVDGKTQLDIDLAGIVQMVAGFGDTDQFDIQLWVRDADGNLATKTLRLAFVDDTVVGEYTLTIVGDGFNIKERMIIPKEDAASARVKVNMTASEGIKNCVVQITTGSPNFSLALDDLGFLEPFDLVNPGEKEGALDSLGLPYGDDVKDQTYLEFDISQFIYLIAIFTDQDDADILAEFTLTVTDNGGHQTTESIMLKILKAN